jgi:hypothetical protein
MPFWHFFHFIIQKNAKMAIFHITLWKNAVSAYFFHFIKRKSAEMAIFYIILWENAILAFFSFYYDLGIHY